MNNVRFKNHPKKQEAEGVESRHKLSFLAWLCAEKPKYNLVQRVLRTAGNILAALLIPAGLGVALGVWMDTLWPGERSWLLLCVPAGLLLGCVAVGLWLFQARETT